LNINNLVVKAQDNEKTISLAYAGKPILEFSELKTGQKSRKFGESFSEDDDWLKKLSFKLKNISDKPIVYLSVNVNFPETRLTGNLMSYPVSFGQRPDSKYKQHNKAMTLIHGETLEVSLDKEKDRIYKYLSERQPIELIQKVELEVYFVIFEDKTAWVAGAFQRQDPNNPDRYVPIED
jgi:hypothetical protein